MTRAKSNSANIRDVALAAGVSVATVSRYLNRNAPVSAEIAERLESTMAELHYIPHAAARRLATQKTQVLGLVITDMFGDFFAPLLSGIELASSEAGYDLLISTTRRLSSGLTSPLNPSNTDGLLVFAGSLNENLLARLYTRKFPIVLIHQSPPAGMDIPCVTVENKDASLKIVDHLISVHGRRRIVLLSGPADHEDARWREAGYRQALAACGMSLDPQLILPGDFDRQVAHASIEYLLKCGVIFDGIFSGDDEAAVGALAALEEAGISVPQEVSIVGFDDQRMAPFLRPPLTTVWAPTEQVGREAAHQLVRLIQGQPVEPLLLLPTRIILRASCGCG